MDVYLTIVSDFENDVEDINMVINGEVCWIKGFDAENWKQAIEFGENLSKSLVVEFIQNFDSEDG